MRLRRGIPIGVTVALLACSGQAVAAERFAEPLGDGPEVTCPVDNPCSLQNAVESPSVLDGDVVTVLAGTYPESNELRVTDAITVRGEPGAPRPTIETTALGGVSVSSSSDALVQDLAIDQAGGISGLSMVTGTAERLRVESSGVNACAVASFNATALLRDSVCLNTNPISGGRAVGIQVGGGMSTDTFTARLRNVTAYGVGPDSIGIDADSGGPRIVVDARNVIASGEAADVRANAGASTSATVSMTSSNYLTAVELAPEATITDPGSGSNQTTQPLLIDAAAGDFTQLPGSPTIDAGTVDGLLGSTDFNGDPRIQGPAPDIGADEIADTIPPETTITAGPGGPTAEGRPTFEFTSSEPGSTFQCQVDLNPYAPCSSPFTADSLNQNPHTFRVRATDPAGNTDPSPAERSFVVDKSVAGANVKAKRSQKQGRKAKLKIVVSAGENVRVDARGKVKAGKRSLSFRSREVTVAADGRRKLTLMPKKRSSNRKLRKALRRGEKPVATLKATFVDDLGNRATSGNVQIKLKEK